MKLSILDKMLAKPVLQLCLLADGIEAKFFQVVLQHFERHAGNIADRRC
jgi:hypothetical protein